MTDKPGIDCVVSFRDADGDSCEFATRANSKYDAVRKAWKWFHSDAWDGSLPMRDTIFRVIAPQKGTFRVLASQALACHPEQSPLFELRRDAFDPR